MTELRSSWIGVVALLAAALTAFGCGGEEQSPPNIVLIVIDTLRADRLSGYGYSRPTTPHLDDLAARGVRFEQASAVAPYTRPSTASILTGVYPSIHGAVTNDRDSIAEGLPTLAERLRTAGYHSEGLIRNGNVAEEFGFGRGFDRYRRSDQVFKGGLSTEERSELRTISSVDDSILAEQALALLEHPLESPFFLYLHLQGGHDPYTPPRGHRLAPREPLTDSVERFYQQGSMERGNVLGKMQRGVIPLDAVSRRQVSSLYDGEVAFADDQVGRILRGIEELGLGHQTIVMVTADHGEELWDHGGMGHGRSLYEEQLHVPWIIAGPGIHPRAISTPVSLIDVTPTLMEFAGLDPDPSLNGRSLAGVIRGEESEAELRPVFSEGFTFVNQFGDPLFFRSIRLGQRKLILDFREQRKRLFDLEADPGESNDLLELESTSGRTLLRTLIRIHRENLESPWGFQAASNTVSPDIRAELRALGYVGRSDNPKFRELFRHPLGGIDWSPYGWLGIEDRKREYLSWLDLAASANPFEQQLLYGWGAAPKGKAWRPMLRKAGVRLGRDRSHDSFELRGFLRNLRNPGRTLALTIRIDGKPTGTFPFRTGERVHLLAELPPGRDASTRIDLECDAETFAFLTGTTYDQIPCLLVEQLGLSSSKGSFHAAEVSPAGGDLATATVPREAGVSRDET